jgi:hypothetical protein
MRWSEEVQLLEEEMHHVLASLWWEAAQWEMRASEDSHQPSDLKRGIVAYAKRQAAIRCAMADKFAKQWGHFQ